MKAQVASMPSSKAKRQNNAVRGVPVAGATNRQGNTFPYIQDLPAHLRIPNKAMYIYIGLASSVCQDPRYV